MFLDYMESPLSIESINIYIDDIGTHIRFINHEKILGHAGFARSHCSWEVSNFGQS